MAKLTDEQLEAIAERAYAEAVHPSEIEARAMIYAYAAAIGLAVGPALKINSPSAAHDERKEK